MFKGITDALRGSSGQFEVSRVVGALGATSYIVCANGFVAWNLWRGQSFDLTAYCLAYPTGLGVAVGSIAGAVAWKDKGVATAKVIADTGSQPGQAAPAGVQDVKVVNPPEDPANVQEAGQ